MTKKRILKLIAICLAGMVAVAAATFILLSLFGNNPDEQAAPTEQSVAAEGVISQVITTYTAGAPTPDNLSVAQLDTAGSAPVATPLGESGLIVTVPGQNSVLFSSMNALDDSQLSRIESTISSALESISVTADKTVYQETYTTYKNDQLICTLFAPKAAPTSSFSCMSSASLANSLSTINELQNTWSNQPGYALLSYKVAKQDMTQLSLLTAYSNEQQVVSMPVFSKEGTAAWTYRANLIPDTEEDETGGGKVLTSNELSELEKSPTFKPLLDELLETTASTQQ